MTATDGLPLPQRRYAIVTLSVALAMTVLDSASVNVALPTIARDLNVSAGESVWVVNAYQLAVTMTLLPFAALGDIFGHRHVFRAGIVVFVCAATACAFADSLTTMTVMRIVEGLGASATMAVNTALVRHTYPRAMLGRGIGMTAMVVAVSLAIGPTVASAVMSVASWRWLLVIGVPFGIAAFALSFRVLPYNTPLRHRFDVLSAFLSAATFGSLIVGLDGIGHGQSRAVVAAELGTALVLGFLLVKRQSTLAYPILPIDLFRRPLFSLSVATSICSFAAQGCAVVSIPFYLHDALGRSQVEIGVLMTPWPVTVAIMAFIAGRLADRYAAGILGGIGLVTMCVGLVLLMLLPANPGMADIMWRMALCGVGFGFFQTPNNRALVGSAPPERSGSVGGVQSTARLLGQTLGATTVALVFGLGTMLGSHPTTAAVAAGACFAAVGAVASCLRLFDRGLPAPSHAPAAVAAARDAQRN